MKDNKIFWIILAIIAVLLLISSGVFSKKETVIPSILTINSANSIVVVKNSEDYQLSNNSKLEIGETYTLEVSANEGFELSVVKLNEEDIFPNLENNTYSFVCLSSVTIEVASILIETGEIPDTPTEYLSFSYYGSMLAQKNLFGLGGVTTGVLNIYDIEYNLLATLEAGETYDYILPGNTYSVEFERLSGWGFAWLHSSLVESGAFEPTAYKNGETFENVFHSLIFRVEYHGAYSSTSYQPVPAPAVGIVDSYNNEVCDLTIGETYTINDITPEGYKVVLSQNGQNLALPHTFVYTEDLRFDIEIVENATEEYTTNTFNLENTHFVLTQYHTEGGYHETHDCPNGIDNFQFEVGGTYCLEITPDDGYQLVEASYNSVTFWTGLESGTLAFSFVVVENAVFEVNAQPYTTITPTITITGYNGDFSNIGVVKFRTDSSVTNYIYDNLIVGEMYLITVGLYASALSNYYISGIYVNGILVGADYSEDTLSMEVGAYKVTSPFNITIEITRK